MKAGRAYQAASIRSSAIPQSATHAATCKPARATVTKGPGGPPDCFPSLHTTEGPDPRLPGLREDRGHHPGPRALARADPVYGNPHGPDAVHQGVAPGVPPDRGDEERGVAQLRERLGDVAADAAGDLGGGGGGGGGQAREPGGVVVLTSGPSVQDPGKKGRPLDKRERRRIDRRRRASSISPGRDVPVCSAPACGRAWGRAGAGGNHEQAANSAVKGPQPLKSSWLAARSLVRCPRSVKLMAGRHESVCMHHNSSGLPGARLHVEHAPANNYAA